MLADLYQLKESAEELVNWGEPQVSGEDPSWLVVERSQGDDSVVLTSPQLPLLIPELNEPDCILVQICRKYWHIIESRSALESKRPNSLKVLFS